MRFLIPFRALLRPSTRNDGLHRRVVRQIAASLGTQAKKTFIVLLAGSLWNLPCSATLATEPATSAATDVSPAPVAATVPVIAAAPGDIAAPEPWNLHGQFTFVKQYHPSFTSPYQGTNSLSPGSNGEETADFTLFAGVRLWNGGAFYINPEIDQGFGPAALAS